MGITLDQIKVMKAKTKVYTIKTTARDIEEWQKAEVCPTGCPILRSLKRQGRQDLRVATFGIVKGKDYHTQIPFYFDSRISEWIAALDDHKLVRPITFKIKLPV